MKNNEKVKRLREEIKRIKSIRNLFSNDIIDDVDLLCMYDVMESCIANPLSDEETNEILDMDIECYLKEVEYTLGIQQVIDIVGRRRFKKWKRICDGLFN